MRRTRFAGAVENQDGASARASVGEALWFDILSPDTPDNHSLSAWRVTALDLCAVLLGVTHLVSAVGLLFLHSQWSLSPSMANPVLPMFLLLVLDAAVITAIGMRDRIGLPPHNVIRCLAAYLGLSGGLWILVGLRNLFRDSADSLSIYDELLVVRPPKRVIGGFLVRF